MALENLAAVSDALGQTFAPQLAVQWNRSAQTAADIAAIPGKGKNAAWDTEFSGDVDAVDVEEGSDVGDAEFDSDENEDATVPWAHYRKSFKITETAIDAAASSAGIPDVLMDLFEERLMGQGARLTSKINRDLISGTGTGTGGNQSIVGLVTAINNTGIYATINRATRSEWASSVLGNGGTPRPLTISLLGQLEQLIFTACGESPTAIRCSPGVWRKYEGLFEEVRRLATDGGGPLEYRAGASRLFWRGVPILRDKDFPSGTLVMENRNYMRTRFLPRAGMPRDAVMQVMKSLAGATGAGPNAIPTMTQIPFRVALLGKTGDSIKCSLKLSLQFCLERPNAFGKITDISEV